MGNHLNAKNKEYNYHKFYIGSNQGPSQCGKDAILYDYGSS